MPDRNPARRAIMNEPRTAAALVIGNELLTGKIQDCNVAALARELFGLGIALRRVVICPDDVDTIAADLELLGATHDLVFTSGGVGPTHDDVTMAAVAKACHRELVRSPELEKPLRHYFGPRLNEFHLRMADVPEGTELVFAEGSLWPTVRVGKIFVLPGLPEIFRQKLPALRTALAGGAPFVSLAVGSRREEGELAELLEDLSRRHPQVSIGSYPRWGDGPLRVVVTFDGRGRAEVEAALTELRSSLPAEEIIEALPDEARGEAQGAAGD